MDSRESNKGKPLEEIGYYHPVEAENQINIDAERVAYWIGVGAKPSDTVKMLLKKQGIPTTAKAQAKD